MRDFDDPVHGPWWYISPSRLIGRLLMLAIGVGAIVYGVTEWLKYEWEHAPTHYPDGRVVTPEQRDSGKW